MEIHSCATAAQARAFIHYTTSSGVQKKNTLDSLDDVANAVLAAQNDMAGSNGGIIDGLIRLEVYNAGLPVCIMPISSVVSLLTSYSENICQTLLAMQELTVIDLPGLTHAPVGDQPKNIHEHISQLIKKYMAGTEFCHTTLLDIITSCMVVSQIQEHCILLNRMKAGI